MIVVAQVGANMLGIIVDRVFDTEEIVVKPVAPILRHITMFSGNTILGDGSVIMILDTNGIARATGIGASGESKARSGGAAADAIRSSEKTAMLLFRADGGTLMAVPLGLVARLEDIPRDKIESLLRPAGHPVPRQADAADLARRRCRSASGPTSPCWCSPTATAPWA